MTDEERQGRIGELLRMRILLEGLLETVEERLEELGHKWKTYASTTFLDQPITLRQVEVALELFEERYPDTNDYQRWLENGRYRYAVSYKGKLYPPKYILSLASGCDLNDFLGGSPTNQVFQQLGFEVIGKPTSERREESTGDD